MSKKKQNSLSKRLLAGMLAFLMVLGGFLVPAKEAYAAQTPGFNVWFDYVKTPYGGTETAGRIIKEPRKVVDYPSLNKYGVGDTVGLMVFSDRNTGAPLYCLEPGVEVVGRSPHYVGGPVTNSKILAAYAYSRNMNWDQATTQLLIWHASDNLSATGERSAYVDQFEAEYTKNRDSNLFKGATGTWYTTSYQSQQIADFEFTPPPSTYAVITKSIDNANYLGTPESGLKLDGYTKAGAKFEIWHEDYTTNGVPNYHTGVKPYAELITSSTGLSDTIEIEPGRYLVIETSATYTGTSINEENSQWIDIKEGTTNWISFRNPAVAATPNLRIIKTNGDGTENLANAVFEVKFYDTWNQDWDNLNSLTPVRTWLFKTDADGVLRFDREYRVGGEGLFTDTITGDVILPLGVYVVQETEAPSGYIIDDTPFRIKIHQVDEAAVIQDVDNKGNGQPATLEHANKQGEYFMTTAHKVDENNRPIRGIKFGLFADPEMDFENVLDVLTTGSDGRVPFYSNQEFGLDKTFYLRELTFAEGQNPGYIPDPTNMGTVTFTDQNKSVSTPARATFERMINIPELPDGNSIVNVLDTFDFSFRKASVEGSTEDEHFDGSTFKVRLIDKLVAKEDPNFVEGEFVQQGGQDLVLTAQDGVISAVGVEFPLGQYELIEVDSVNSIPQAEGASIIFEAVEDINGDNVIDSEDIVIISNNTYEGALLGHSSAIQAAGYSESYVVDYVEDNDYVFYNAPEVAAIGITLEVIKIDSQTGAEILQAGVTFELYDSEDNLVTTMTTQDDGTAYASQLRPGNYYLKEIAGPEGYYTNPDEIYHVEVPNIDNLVQIRLIVDGAPVEGGTTDVENTPQYGRLQFQKVGEAFAGWVPSSVNVEVQEVGKTVSEPVEEYQANVALELRTTITGETYTPAQTYSGSYTTADGVETEIQPSSIEFLSEHELTGPLLETALTEGQLLEEGIDYTDEEGNTLVLVPDVMEEVTTEDYTTSTSVSTDEYGYLAVEVGEGFHEVYDAEGNLLASSEGPSLIEVQLPTIIKGETERELGGFRTERIDYNQATFAETGLAGAEFKLTAVNQVRSMDGQTVFFEAGEDIPVAQQNITLEGVIVYNKGDVITIPELPAEIMNNKAMVDTKVVTTPEPTVVNLLPIGSYNLVETKAPRGYKLDSTARRVDILPEANSVLIIERDLGRAENERQVLTARLNKKVLETNEIFRDTSFRGIVFGLYNRNEVMGLAPNSLVAVVQPNEEGIMTVYDLPEGDYYFKELFTKDGYELNDREVDISLESDPTTLEDVVETSEVEIENRLIRKDINLVKVDVDTRAPIEGVEFELYAVDHNGVEIPVLNKLTGTSIFRTDKDGRISVGGLTLGTYIWKEVRAALGYVTDNSSFKFSVSEDAPLEIELTNEKTSLSFRKYDSETGQPVVGATLELVDADGNVVMIREENGEWVATHSSEGQPARWVTDGTYKVIRGLIPGETYLLREVETADGYSTAQPVSFTVNDQKGIQLTSLGNKQTEVRIIKENLRTGEPVYGAVFEVYEMMEDGTLGTEVIATWTTSEENGASNLLLGLVAGKEYALVEATTPTGFLDPAEDIFFTVEDSLETQTIVVTNEEVPTLKTTALSEHDTKNVLGSVETVIYDVVEFTNLLVGRTYVTNGVVMDKATGQPLLDADGNEIRQTLEFVAEAEEQEVVLEFRFNGVGLEGTTAVVFEDLYRNGREIAVHRNIDDVDQTVYFPEVKTKAHAKDGSDLVKLADNIAYDDAILTNLIPGQSYKLVAVLVNHDGSVEIAEKEYEFVAENASETHTIEVRFDSDKYKGQNVVFFESLFELKEDGTWNLVGKHEDITDTDQTLTVEEYPTVKTKAHAKDGSNLVKINDGEAYDDVIMTGLSSGQKYKLVAELMNADGSKVLGMNEYEFIASESDEVHTVKVTFDSSNYAGQSVVFFETLYMEFENFETGEKEWRQVGEHKDLQDQDQTLKIDERPPVEEKPKTDDPTNKDTIIILGVVALALIAVGGVLFLQNQRKKEKKDEENTEG